MDSHYIGILGREGTFSYEIAQRIKGPQEQIKSICALHQIVNALKSQSVHSAIVPIENSTTGLIRPIVDGLLETGVWITQMATLKIQHHLVTRRNGEGLAPKYLYVQREAFDQCLEVLQHRTETVRYTESSSDSWAALLLHPPGEAIAVVSRTLIQQFEGALNVIQWDIQSYNDNSTRFARIELPKVPRESTDLKTFVMVAATIKHRVGALGDLLNAIAKQQIDIRALHSRPLPNSPGHYRFVLELEAQNTITAETLKWVEVQGNVMALSILGTWSGE